MSLPTIEATVRGVEGLTDEQVSGVTGALLAREETMADMMRMAGLQFGLYPEIVSEVFAEIGIGNPIDDATRAMIRQQFVMLMERLQAEHGGGS